MKKILLAGLIGGVVNFAWGAFWHMAVPWSKGGLSRLPNEDDVRDGIREQVRQPGFYFFPWKEEPADASAERKEAIEKKWTEEFRRGPSGLLILRRSGEEPMQARLFLTEIASDVLCGLVAAALLCQAAKAGAGYPGRVLFCALLGLFGSLAIDVSYWNWYEFPTAFLQAALVDQTAGWALAGLAIAALVKKPPAPLLAQRPG